MTIQSNPNRSTPITNNSVLAGGRAAGVETPAACDDFTRSYHSQALASANLMVSAPAAPSPLSAIPTSWFPNGQQSRPYGGYLGAVAIPRTSGTATVNRTDDSISLSSPHGDFSMRTDPNNAGRVVVNTPQGEYNGTVRTGRNGDVIFDAGNNRSVTMRRVTPRFFGQPYIEISASGFGLPAGHLRVFNP